MYVWCACNRASVYMIKKTKNTKFILKLTWVYWLQKNRLRPNSLALSESYWRVRKRDIDLKQARLNRNGLGIMKAVWITKIPWKSRSAEEYRTNKRKAETHLSISGFCNRMYVSQIENRYLVRKPKVSELTWTILKLNQSYYSVKKHAPPVCQQAISSSNISIILIVKIWYCVVVRVVHSFVFLLENQASSTVSNLSEAMNDNNAVINWVIGIRTRC